jgi:hypothetical protein
MEIASALVSILALAVLAIGAVGYYYASVIVHELGHLCAALLVGWKPLGICIGSGNPRTIFRIRDFDIELGSKFSGGVAFARARSMRWFRLSQFIFILGGPLASGLLAATLFVVATALEDTTNPLIEPSWLWILFAVECWLILCNLLSPSSVELHDEALPSDGAVLLQTLRLKKADVAAGMLEQAFYCSRRLLKKGCISAARPDLTNELYLSGEEEKITARTWWIWILADEGHLDSAKAECEQLIMEYPPGTEARSGVLDTLACLPVFYGSKALIPEAMKVIEMAIAEEPDKITLKGTKGSLLIERGDVEQGLELVEQVLKESESENDRAICTWYLALAAHKLGRLEEAQEKLKEAKLRAPEHLVGTRIEKEILSTGVDPVLEKLD